MPVKNAKLLTPLFREDTSEIGRDRDRCSEIKEITIPFYNFCKSIKYSWFVSSATLVPVKKCEIVHTVS